MYVNPYALTLIFPCILMLAVSLWILRNRRERAIQTFSVLTILCALYSVGYALEISSSTLELKLFWVKVEYIAIAFIPALLLLFALDYAGLVGRSYYKLAVALSVIPLMILICIYTNDFHNLFYQDISLIYGGPFPVIYFERGPFYYAHTVYVALTYHLSLFVMFWLWFKTRGAHRAKIECLIFALIIPWLSTLLYFFRIISPGIDFNPFALSLSTLLIFWGLLYYQLFDLIPIARSRLFEDLADGVMIFDSNFQIVDFNSSAAKYLDLPAGAIGKSATDIFRSRPKLLIQIYEPAERARISLDEDVMGDSRFIDFDFLPLQDNRQSLYGQMVLIRENRDLEMEQYRYLAETDDLTGLPNRRYFLRNFEKELERARRYDLAFSLLLLDVDHFKLINDTLGHYTGDRVLQSLALTLKGRMREVDTVARLGGDEFGILLPNTSQADAFVLAESLREIISATPYADHEDTIMVTVSIGISAYYNDNSTVTVDLLLKEADNALYRAKEKGRNCTVK